MYMYVNNVFHLNTTPTDADTKYPHSLKYFNAVSRTISQNGQKQGIITASQTFFAIYQTFFSDLETVWNQLQHAKLPTCKQDDMNDSNEGIDLMKSLKQLKSSYTQCVCSHNTSKHLLFYDAIAKSSELDRQNGEFFNYLCELEVTIQKGAHSIDALNKSLDELSKNHMNLILDSNFSTMSEPSYNEIAQNNNQLTLFLVGIVVYPCVLVGLMFLIGPIACLCAIVATLAVRGLYTLYQDKQKRKQCAQKPSSNQDAPPQDATSEETGRSGLEHKHSQEQTKEAQQKVEEVQQTQKTQQAPEKASKNPADLAQQNSSKSSVENRSRFFSTDHKLLPSPFSANIEMPRIN